jgi:hypothetical protein
LMKPVTMLTLNRNVAIDNIEINQLVSSPALSCTSRKKLSLHSNPSFPYKRE